MYAFFWYPLYVYVYVYVERDHISMLKPPKTYIEQIVEPLLMQCFLNVFDLSIVSVSHPTTGDSMKHSGEHWVRVMWKQERDSDQAPRAPFFKSK